MKIDAGSNYYLLTISNNGNPFPPEVDVNKAETLGLRLIYSLVKQLGGTLELRKDPTPLFTIHFPKA